LKIRLLPVIFAAAIVGLSAHASAARVYYLVGMRHVYMFDVWPDTHALDRQAIEESYAGAVADGQAQYDRDMASIRTEETADNNSIHQTDRDAVQQNLEQDIAVAADKRDENLSQLYVECDYVRGAHPEFAVEQDGPYRVMGVDEGSSGEIINVSFYQPYPAYEEPCPFGWVYGRPYAFGLFGIQVTLWHSTWLNNGCPVFAPIYYGGSRIIVLAPVRRDVICSREGWHGGRPPSITFLDRRNMTQYRDLQRKAGLRPASTHPKVTRPIRAIESGSSRYFRPSGSGGTTDGATGTRPWNNGSTSRYGRNGTLPRSGTTPNSGSRYRAPGAPGSTTGNNPRYQRGKPGNNGSNSGGNTGSHSGGKDNGGSKDKKDKKGN